MSRLALGPSSRSALLIRLVLAVATVGMLCLLAWGIIRDNLAAAAVAGGTLAVLIVLEGSVFLAPDDLRSQAMRRTLSLASATLGHMSSGLTRKGSVAVCQLLLAETGATAIAITNTRAVLAYVGEGTLGVGGGGPLSDATREVLKSGRVLTFTNPATASDGMAGSSTGKDAPRLRAAVFAPLKVADHCVGTIKFYYRHSHELDRTQLTIVRGFAELLSTQLSTHELERQAELTARAEVKALQAQINPHFLFNALNTMAALTRTDPARARDLLREFAVYYRCQLESTESLIPLQEELAQTRRYLKIEKARFGDDRIVESEMVGEGCENVMVPGFIVQPIVENSVRHGMRDEGMLHIDIQVTTDGDDVLLAVADDGVGMDVDAERRLMDADASRGGARGTGVALRNVADRVRHFYGEHSGVEIMSKQGEGTVVTLRLARVALRIGRHENNPV